MFVGVRISVGIQSSDKEFFPFFLFDEKGNYRGPNVSV